MSEVLVIDGHPRAGSLVDGLASAYAAAAEERVGVRRLNLRELAFDPILHHGFTAEQPLEPDLVAAQAAITAARHLVFVYPTWWGTYPALLKGFVDRVFLPGFGFRFRSPTRWDKLLAGRSARLVVTLDWPVWAYRWLQGAPGRNAMATATLGFCGVRPVRITELSPVHGSDDAARARFVERVRRDARRDVGHLPNAARRALL
ncbi:MAG: NAD(P)H-dependent oxidoreductase [Myxococcota bacterium]